MEYIGEILEITDPYKVVGLDYVEKTDDENSILVTCNILSCIVVIIVTNQEAFMIHLSENNKDGMSFDILKDVMANIDGIIDIKVFPGVKADSNNIEKVKEITGVSSTFVPYLDVNYESGGIYPGSICYNKNTHEYYGYDSDFNFHEYKLGYINKSEDMMRKFR